jgi:Ion channel
MRTKTVGYGMVLLLTIASIALALSVSTSDATRFATIVLQAATLVAAVRTADVHGGTRLAALAAVLVVLAAAVGWAIAGDVPATPAAIVSGLLVGVAPVAIARGLLRDLREQRGVTLSTLAGVLAVYLLAGMFFSFLYGIVGAIDPDRLFSEVADSTREDQLYFSFVTLCTVGYGDLTPVGGWARGIAVSEMLIGQIYLVTIVSLIVSNLGARRR